jgi:hypothetical protein
MIYKKLHRTLKIEQHEPHYKRDAPECEQFLLQVLHPSLLRHHDLVNRYEIFESQRTKDMFRLS